MDPPDGSFEVLCRSCKVPDDVIQEFLAQDFCNESFALLALSHEELDIRLQEMTLPAISARSRASIRLLWQRCKGALDTEPAKSSTPESAAEPSGWSESFPPKLKAETIKQLRQAFESHYLSELLDNDNLPGPRLLALVYSQVQKKNSIG